MAKRNKTEEKEIRVYFCPSCKSHDVKYVFGLTNVFGMIPKMKCLNCNYSAPGFPVLVTNKKEIESRSKKLKKKSVKKKSKVKKRSNKK